MNINKIIASGLGTGYSTFAPGTVGSLLGVVVFYIINSMINRLDLQSLNILVLNLAFIGAVTLLGVYSIKQVHKVWEHDASAIVIDEIVGVCIAAFAIPFRWEYYLMAFVLFRFFDIAKPLFIRKLDNMKGNWSVMLDDILAGVYANVVLQLIVYANFI